MHTTFADGILDGSLKIFYGGDFAQIRTNYFIEVIDSSIANINVAFNRIDLDI
ncbi:MAG: hypothetical protein AAFW75_05695 [Cyanobacteria bacterium J06636_16]